jgi:DNA-binding transcriptional LysR family regulator
MEQVATWLKDGTADLGLTYDVYPDSDIDHELITQLAPFVMVSAKNPLAQEKVISLKDLEDKPLIFMDSPGFREYFLYYFGMYGLKPSVLHRPTTNEMVRGMLAAGNGYSIGLVKIKNTHSYDGSPLVNIELKEVPPRVNLVVATLKGFRHSRLVETFINTCKKRLNHVATGTSAKHRTY